MNRFLTPSLLLSLVVSSLLWPQNPLAGQEISFLDHTVTSSFTGGREVYVCDVNRDGYRDIVAAGDAAVSWWENDGALHFTEHVLTTNVNIARSVRADDIDGDDDIDIVAAICFMDEIRCWRNDGEENFEELILNTTMVGPHTIDLKDVNGDGHLDILCSGFDMSDAFSEIAWYENDGLSGFTKHVISERFQQSPFIYGAFINDDDYMDILACGEVNGEVLWWENDGSEQFAGHEHLIDGNYPMAHTVLAKDVDGDGDTDILGAACMSSLFTWWENDGSEVFEKHHIENFAGALWNDAVDLDKDGDNDLIGAGMGTENIAWWENDGYQNFTHRTIPGSLPQAYCVVYADMDNDKDDDLVAIGNSSNRINWYENDLYSFGFSGEPLSGHAPLTVQFHDLSNTDPPITTWAWDFDGDGTIDSDQPEPVWVYEQSGTYSVRLDVSSDSLSHTLEYPDYIRVFDGESALMFNGNESHASCPAAPDINLTEAVTMEAWINPAGWGEVIGSGQGRILDKRYVALYLNGEGNQSNDHSLVFMIVNTSGPPKFSVTPANSISLNEWQHVAASYDASTGEVAVYIDGMEQVIDQNDNPSGPIRDNSEKTLTIGNIDSGIYCFEGLIDKVRVWTRIRTGEAIAAGIGYYLQGTEPGLQAYWRMNEGNGSEIHDETQYNHEATITCTQWYSGIPLEPLSVIHGDIIGYPETFQLNGLFPNPSHGNIVISLFSNGDRALDIHIHDLHGRLVRTIEEDVIDAGYHSFAWNGRDVSGHTVPSGTYLCTVESGEYSETEKILFVK